MPNGKSKRKRASLEELLLSFLMEEDRERYGRNLLEVYHLAGKPSIFPDPRQQLGTAAFVKSLPGRFGELGTGTVIISPKEQKMAFEEFSKNRFKTPRLLHEFAHAIQYKDFTPEQVRQYEERQGREFVQGRKTGIGVRETRGTVEYEAENVIGQILYDMLFKRWGDFPIRRAPKSSYWPNSVPRIKR